MFPTVDMSIVLNTGSSPVGPGIPSWLYRYPIVVGDIFEQFVYKRVVIEKHNYFLTICMSSRLASREPTDEVSPFFPFCAFFCAFFFRETQLYY